MFCHLHIQTLSILNMIQNVISLGALDHFGDILRDNTVNRIYDYFF